MRRILAWAALACAACASGAGPEVEGPTTLRSLPPDLRLHYLREATVWSPIDTDDVDMREGPPGGRFEAGEVLECRFFMPDAAPSGYTPKFLCRTHAGETYKIKFGRDNLEVYGEVIGSRLLWALGFRSDRVDPVTVRCSGCPEDPWKAMKSRRPEELPPPDEVREFVPAIVETYFGTLMESEEEQGVDWKELLGQTSRDPIRAGRQRVHRQALALLMGFLQHADSKPSQQTLSCGPGGIVRTASGDERCRDPELYVGDVGAILGDGWKYKRASTTKVDYERWKETPVWADADACVFSVHGRPNASLGDTAVTEAARGFLAGRLSQLSRDQLTELFAMARVELLEQTLQEGDTERTVTAEDWAALFQEKSKAIIDHRCPD